MLKSTHFRLSVSLAAIVVSILFLASVVGLVPDRRQERIKGRSALCESLANTCSTLLNANDTDTLRRTLEAIVEHNKEIRAVAVRRENGATLVSAGDESEGGDSADASSAGGASEGGAAADVSVPLLDGETIWGRLEVNFHKSIGAGLFSRDSEIWLVAFVAVALVLVFPLFLRRSFKYVDPTQTVPEHVQNVVDTLMEGLVLLNGENRIVLANSTFAGLMGKPASELVGVEIASLPLTFANNVSDEAPWEAVKRDGENQRNILTHLDSPFASDRVLRLNCSAIRGLEGELRGVMLSFQDITQIVRKNEELSDAKAEADRANRAKSDFLASMSHEIRTPMNAIMGFADLLRGGGVNESDGKRYLSIIHSSGTHLLGLINEILDLSKIEAGRLTVERERCSPHQIIADTAAVLGIQAKKKGVEFVVSAEGDLPETVATDALRFRQILTNLIGNAIKFTNAGAVRITARCEAAQRDGTLFVDIADSGIGIAKENLEKIFEPFTQEDGSTTRRFGGTGLGLTICRRLARALGGDVTVMSEVGRGSVFTVAIETGALDHVDWKPFHPNDLAATETSEPQRPIVSLPSARILVVDDGQENRELIATILKRAGVKATTASDGREALNLVAENDYDVILMDVEMPGMDGLTAVKFMRHAGISCPVIALTAHAMSDHKATCLAAGYSDFMTKPIAMDLLLHTLSNMLDGAPRDEAPAPSLESSPVAARFAPVDDEEPLISTLPADDPVFAEFIVTFVDKLHAQLERMRRAAEDSDFNQLRGLAHWLKGSGGTVGFHAFTDPALRLENLAIAGDREQASGAIDALARLADRIVVPSSMDREEVHALV